MSERRRGLGRGIGALIPSSAEEDAPMVPAGRPTDVFFPSSSTGDEAPAAPSAARASARSLMEPSKRIRRSNGRPEVNGKAAAGHTSEPAPEAAPPLTDITAAPKAPDSTDTARVEAATAAPPDGAPTATDASNARTIPADVGGEGLVPVPGATYAELPVDAIVANRRQPRQIFDEEDLDELAASIREVGVLQPIVVRHLPDAGEGEPAYELIMGERRWRASQQAGNATVPAIVRETGDGALLRDALLENLHRANLNPLEEAAAYQQLLEDFGCTHDELATRIARSRPQISNTLRLMKLPPLVQRRVAAGVLSAGHARALLGLSDGAAMERLAQKIVAEGLSVRATEEIVALGDEPVAPEMRRRPRTSAHTEDLNRLATRLADRLDTRVRVNLGQRKGRIAIEFASVEDLNRILEVLAPGEDRVPTAAESQN